MTAQVPQSTLVSLVPSSRHHPRRYVGQMAYSTTSETASPAAALVGLPARLALVRRGVVLRVRTGTRLRCVPARGERVLHRQDVAGVKGRYESSHREALLTPTQPGPDVQHRSIIGPIV